MTKLYLSFFFSILVFFVKAQDLKKYESGRFTKGKDTLAYRILYPENFDQKAKYPVLFFLHGRGECGNDNQKQLINGGKLFLKPEYRKQFPAIVIFPQCPTNSYWANVKITTNNKGKRSFSFTEGGPPTAPMHALQHLVKHFLKNSFVNKKQVYVGGLSMGGMGTYELLRRLPNKFAAAFAICGGDNTNNVERYKKIPLWIFHGAKDDVVDPAYSMAVAERLKNVGKEVKFTLYPNANHNSWDSAFAETDLLPWIFSHHR